MKADRYDHISDTELLARYTADTNSEWIGILLERYTLLLFGVCMKYLKNEEEAKDAVQQVFLKVLGEAGKYKIEFFKSWLYMVAKNHCLMRLRSMQGKHPREITENIPLVAADEDRLTVIENERTFELLEASIFELGREQQQCVTLFYLQKKSYGQICEHTGFSMMQVKRYIQNGKRNLKQLLEKKMKESSIKK